ncbi:unnamed protein product [Diatraea saccharalis]|uniref:Lipase domain-containing protein n=1 Tax=Diatraea saccharalis TaxID=40085 RepID=A0A9N9WAZ8_9NEOP|nr:unnamed protein product [Diatraea saccharalis]
MMYHTSLIHIILEPVIRLVTARGDGREVIMSPLFYLISVLFLSSICGANSWSVFKSSLYGLVECTHDKNANMSVDEVQIYLYDFQNQMNFTFKIDAALDGITSQYNLDVSRRLILYVPGFKSNIYKPNEELIRQTFKDVKNIYLIMIDHSAYTNGNGGKVKSYERSVSYAYYIGKALGQFLAGLHEKGYPTKNIHCIGHSLGAQMLGYAGVMYYNKTSEKIPRITGLDPAGPCFSNALIDEQIRSGVADYVEVYHCNAGGLGTTAVLADADFFFNRGRKQPTCLHSVYLSIPGYGEYESAKCSHKACVRLWAASVGQPNWYLAWACNTYENFQAGSCAGNQMTLAGYWNPGNATGIFYVSTYGYEV